ncbi:MAG: hypothetical protein DIU78_010415 [Pseudomonadota bacterium]
MSTPFSSGTRGAGVRSVRSTARAKSQDHPPPGPKSIQRQVVWDETTADAAARWVLAHTPVRRLLAVAGKATA